MIDFGVVDTFVYFTEEAKTEIRRQLALHNDPDEGVRVIVVIDRYAGFVFDLEFDTPNENDHKALVDGIPVFTSKSFLEYVKGMKIHYNHDIPAFNFENENPQYNCVPGKKFECPSCNLYEERKDDPKYADVKV